MVTAWLLTFHQNGRNLVTQASNTHFMGKVGPGLLILPQLCARLFGGKGVELYSLIEKRILRHKILLRFPNSGDASASIKRPQRLWFAGFRILEHTNCWSLAQAFFFF